MFFSSPAPSASVRVAAGGRYCRAQIYTKDDLFHLFPAEVRPWDAMLLWGTTYSRSTLHVDPYNWTGTVAVIRGRKRWKVNTIHVTASHTARTSVPDSRVSK